MKQLLEKRAKPKTNISRYSLVALAVLCTATALFEYAPVIDEARRAFPKNFGAACDCSCALESRPWYGQINQRLWFWLVSTPLVVFVTKPAAPQWLRSLRSVVIIALSSGTVILAVPEAFEVVNAPFYGDGIWHTNGVLSSSEADVFKSRCFNASDSGPLAFSLLFGWIPALVYTGWWEIVWGVYHKRKTRLIDARFKRDWISKTVIFSSVAIPLLIIAWGAWKMTVG